MCLSLVRASVVYRWDGRLTGRVFRFKFPSTIVYQLRKPYASRMERDQTSEKMLKPGKHMTHISY